MDTACASEVHHENHLSSSLDMQHIDNDMSLIARIQEALNIIHGSSSSKDARREASLFIDQIKSHEQAPNYGFKLASDSNRQPVIRHYGLLLLEHAVKYKWQEYSKIQEITLRDWVIHLAKHILPSDPVYLRNKITQLWVEIAKRSWLSTWKNMDESLVELWIMDDLVYKDFVFLTLETLSDEIFCKEDAAVIMRGDALQKNCMDIFAPAIAISQAFPDRSKSSSVRFGEDGWLVRMGEFLNYILQNNLYQTPQSSKCIVRVLSVYKSVMTWIFSKAISSSSCVHYMIESLTVSNVAIQLASVETLYNLYRRLHFTDEEFVTLVCPIFTSKMVNMLQKLFEWSCGDPRDIDEEKYLFSKKFSEMISCLGNLIEKKITVIPKDCDLANLFNLFLAVAQSPSFIVSIPVLQVWARLLQSDIIFESPAIHLIIVPLLELTCSRLLRYDVMPENSEDPSLIFLLEDIDTVPERHAFLGNYRRYCIQIIEFIVFKKHSEAIHHIMSQAELSLRYLHDAQEEFSVENYSKYSLPVLKVDAQFIKVEAALRGYMKWRSGNASEPHQVKQNQIDIESFMEAWCERLLSLKFEDPIIRKRVLQICVVFSTSALDQRTNFMLKVLEHILTNRILESPEHTKYSEAVREMQMDSLHELQRLAIKMPDQLLDVYDQLEMIVNEIISSGTVDMKIQVAFQTFLFTVIHRNSKLEPESCYKKLMNFIRPIQLVWQDPDLDQTLSSFDGFCHILGLDKVKKFLSARMVHQIDEWSSYQLDNEGREIQKELEERLAAFPLRTTKSFLQCSMDRLGLSSPKLQISRELWRDVIPIILPKLLKFLSYAHAFNNPVNWTGLPPEMTPVITRILSERFWQAGISEGSKEDFYARISGTKSTMEGLASSIRGSVRIIRETTYGIFYCLSRFDVDFYGYSGLPGPLAHSLFTDAQYLPSHQLINLLQVVRLLVDDCPVEFRAQFVPPLLGTCYTQLDIRSTMQWEKLTELLSSTISGENLTDEMKEESLLRQITHAAVMMIGTFLDHSRNSDLASTGSAVFIRDNDANNLSMREFCLSSKTIMEPVLTFLSHAIGMRDTRSCGIVLRIFRSIIPDFTKNKTILNGKENTEFFMSIREFICRNVLMACISSFNEPYFVDLQKDIAHCIVSILTSYGEESTVPRTVLLSIPRIQERTVDQCLEQLKNSSLQIRHQRALVLDLLSEIKGISVSEQGRISKSASTSRKERSKMIQDFMKEDNGGIKLIESPVLESVAAMFAD